MLLILLRRIKSIFSVLVTAVIIKIFVQKFKLRRTRHIKVIQL